MLAYSESEKASGVKANACRCVMLRLRFVVTRIAEAATATAMPSSLLILRHVTTAHIHSVLGVALPWLHALLLPADVDRGDDDKVEAREEEGEEARQEKEREKALLERGCAALIAATRDERVRRPCLYRTVPYMHTRMCIKAMRWCSPHTKAICVVSDPRTLPFRHY